MAVTLSREQKEKREDDNQVRPDAHTIGDRKIAVFQVARNSVSGIKLSSKETAAVVWERGRQIFETTPLRMEGGVCETTGRKYERSVTN